MSDEKEFHIRISKEIHTKLNLLAKEKGIAKRWLMASALEEYLGGGREETVDGLRKEICELKRRVAALRGDVEIVGELLSFFIYHWLGYTPRLNKAERVSLATEAKERHEKFMAMFVRKLEKGELKLSPVLERGAQFEDGDPTETV